MARGGFWDFQGYWQTVTSGSYWFDAEWKQRRDINMLEAEEMQVVNDLGTLQTALGQAQKQLFELSMTVVVMAQMLEEAGHLDTNALHERIDAELDKLRRPKPVPAPAPAPIAAAPSKPKVHDTPVACGRCGKTVPSSQTTITASGTVCDSCAGV